MICIILLAQLNNVLTNQPLGNLDVLQSLLSVHQRVLGNHGPETKQKETQTLRNTSH